MVLELPWPPSNNTYYRKFRNMMVISKKGREYKETVGKLLSQCPSFGSERLQVKIYCYPPDKRVRDLDNINKALWDSLTGIVFDDDSQIDELHMYRCAIIKKGKILMEITKDEGRGITIKTDWFFANPTARETTLSQGLD